MGAINAPTVAKLEWAVEILFPLCTTAVKLSILLLYRRMFTTFNRFFSYACNITGALILALCISAVFTDIFQCNPQKLIWTGFQHDKCIDLAAAFTGLTTVNTVMNTAILILPLPVIWTLRLSKTKRVALGLVFALGGAYVIQNYRAKNALLEANDTLVVTLLPA